MKTKWMLLAFVTFNFQATLAETMAGSMMDETWDMAELQINKPTAPTSSSLPDYPPEVAETLRKLNIPLEAARGGSNHPVVTVDKSTQTITIVADALPSPWVSKVSTGGGLKIPNGEKVVAFKKPYCASTPEIGPKFIPAVQFGPNPTMFKKYESNTFSYDGVPAQMPYAIRLEGGIFFHQVPNGTLKFNTDKGKKSVYYSHLLGHNVSGECIRLSDQTAKLLYGLALKYGGITASVKGPDPEPVKQGYCKQVNGKTKCFSPNYCDEQTLAYANKGVDVAQKSGGGFFNALSNFFSGGGGSSSGAPSKPKSQRERQDEAWRYPLGDPFGN